MAAQDPQHHTLITAQILEWYNHMGVDEALDSTTADWFERSKKPVAKPAPPQNQRSVAPQQAPNRMVLQQKQASRPAQSGFQHMPQESAVMDARTQARSAQSLEELESILRGFNGCSLKNTAKNTCISRGNPESQLMFIGEAPGRDEDIQGRPFVGRAGQLLDKMLSAIGHDENSVYITNIVYWRPPGNRTPTPQEAQICQPFLERQIELIKPKIMVFLGGAAAKQMLNTTEGIMRLRGKWKTYKTDDINCKSIATLHPAYLLRNPAGKRQAWQDFLNVKVALQKMQDQ